MSLEQKSKRIDAILRSSHVPLPAQIGIKQIVAEEMRKLASETADAVRLIALYACHTRYGYGQTRLEHLNDDIQELINHYYGEYQLDAVFALKLELENDGIKFEEEMEEQE